MTQKAKAQQQSGEADKKMSFGFSTSENTKGDMGGRLGPIYICCGSPEKNGYAVLNEKDNAGWKFVVAGHEVTPADMMRGLNSAVRVDSGLDFS